MGSKEKFPFSVFWSNRTSYGIYLYAGTQGKSLSFSHILRRLCPLLPIILVGYLELSFSTFERRILTFLYGHQDFFALTMLFYSPHTFECISQVDFGSRPIGLIKPNGNLDISYELCSFSSKSNQVCQMVDPKNYNPRGVHGEQL